MLLCQETRQRNYKNKEHLRFTLKNFGYVKSEKPKA